MDLRYFLDYIRTEIRGKAQLHQLNVVARSSMARLEHKRLICQQGHCHPFTPGEWMLFWEHTHDRFPANYLFTALERGNEAAVNKSSRSVPQRLCSWSVLILCRLSPRK